MVEHQSRKLGVVGSNPIGGIYILATVMNNKKKRFSQLAGFEPTRAEPIGFQVQRLNHSATTAPVNKILKSEKTLLLFISYLSWFYFHEINQHYKVYEKIRKKIRKKFQ